ncbi:MAG: helix-turn-helix transcriptional regulator [Bacillota bacterium]
MYAQNMGSRIRESRKRRGITQKELAEMLHVSKSLVSDIERGQRRLCAELLNDIANLLGVSADYLLGRTDTEPPTQSC